MGLATSALGRASSAEGPKHSVVRRAFSAARVRCARSQAWQNSRWLHPVAMPTYFERVRIEQAQVGIPALISQSGLEL